MTLRFKYFFFLFQLVCLTRFTQAGEFDIGSGSYDITGPSVEREMLGYARGTQFVSGIFTRIRARSFVIENLAHTDRIALVNVDLHSVSLAVKEGVLTRLNQIFPDLYSHSNVLITAIHNHSTTGGYSEDRMLNLSTLGLDQKNYNVIVEGIVKSIQMAHSNRVPGHILIQTGNLAGASMNRSRPAYQANPEKINYPTEVDQKMTLLRFQTDQGQEIGLFNWFAVHNTSMSDKNSYISSDNKGMAAYLFENLFGGPSSSFVAAFANSNEGDVSPYPNIYTPPESTEMDEFERTFKTGRLQFQKAKELFDTATKKLSPELGHQHHWVKMPEYTVTDAFTGTTQKNLCHGAVGLSFANGTDDGPSHLRGFRPGLKQGDSFASSLIVHALRSIFNLTIFRSSREDENCHFPKPIFLATGRHHPAWITETLPFQLIRIGSLGIIAVPSEMTTMAGRKLRETVLRELKNSGITQVVIAGLSNHYSLYVATQSEYNEQFYEGAATLFGPYTLAAYQQIFTGLSHQLTAPTPLLMDESKKPPSQGKLKLNPPVKNSSIPSCGTMKSLAGRVLNKIEKIYKPGQTVEVSFQSVNPNHDFMTQSSFLEVQFKSDLGNWIPIAYDWDPETRFRWKRDPLVVLPPYGRTTVFWKIPEDRRTGHYRIIHQGIIKIPMSNTPCSYTGISPEFLILKN